MKQKFSLTIQLTYHLKDSESNEFQEKLKIISEMNECIQCGMLLKNASVTEGDVLVTEIK